MARNEIYDMNTTKSKVISVYSILPILLGITNAEILLSCNKPGPVCPNTDLMYLCESNDTIATYIIWQLPYGECNKTALNPIRDSIRLLRSKLSLCDNANGICGRFMAKNTLSSSTTYCTSSMLTVRTALNLNGTVIACSTYAFQFLSSINSSIQITSFPQQPSITLLSQLTSVTVLVNSAEGAVPDYFNISIYNADGNFVSSEQTTSKNTPIALLPNTNYTFSIIAVNCVGSSHPALFSTCTLASPPTDIQASISSNILNIVWNDMGQCTSQYWIRIANQDAITINRELVDCYYGCIYTQLINGTSNYYFIYISSVTKSGIGPESVQVKTQPQFEVIISEIQDKSITLKCLNERPNVSTYMCYVCCSDSLNKIVSNASLDKGGSTTVTLTQLLDGETYTCIAVTTDDTVLSCSSGSLRSYLRSDIFNFTVKETAAPQPLDITVTAISSAVASVLAVIIFLIICIAIRKNTNTRKQARIDSRSDCDSMSNALLPNNEEHSINSDQIDSTTTET